jgi:thiol-disulfide isomerase/thioredoxin
MLELLSHYARLQHDAAVLLVAFAVASWFPDCIPVAPVFYLLGPENEASLMLRLLGCLCRRPVLLGDIDMAALGALPGELNATMLINQRNLARHVERVLLASNNRHFCIARDVVNFMLTVQMPFPRILSS